MFEKTCKEREKIWKFQKRVLLKYSHRETSRYHHLFFENVFIIFPKFKGEHAHIWLSYSNMHFNWGSNDCSRHSLIFLMKRQRLCEASDVGSDDGSLLAPGKRARKRRKASFAVLMSSLWSGCLLSYNDRTDSHCFGAVPESNVPRILWRRCETTSPCPHLSCSLWTHIASVIGEFSKLQSEQFYRPMTHWARYPTNCFKTIYSMDKLVATSLLLK